MEQLDLASRQEAARAEILLGRLTVATWSRESVLEILRGVSTPALRRLMLDYQRFSGIFKAGRQVADWCWEEIKRRDP